MQFLQITAIQRFASLVHPLLDRQWNNFAALGLIAASHAGELMTRLLLIALAAALIASPAGR
jgi:hypothetical protein